MQITKDVHLLHVTKDSYAYLVLGDEPVLVDTCLPGRSDAILKELESIGLQPTDLAHIVLTHHDVDHIGNAHALQQVSGAKLWASQEDVPYILGQRNRPGMKRLAQMIARIDIPQIDETYTPGQRIGGLEVIPTPGHTPGHVSFLFGEALLSGDLVINSKGRLQPASALLTWNRTALKHSLREVEHLPFTWVCPAHGEPIQRGHLWDTLLAHLEG